MRKHRLKSLLKISFCFSSVLGDACGRPVKGASWETVEPLDLSNTVLILTEGKSKSALPVDVSVTEADISPFLMRTYNPDSLEPCALAWRHWPQSKERLPFFFFLICKYFHFWMSPIWMWCYWEFSVFYLLVITENLRRGYSKSSIPILNFIFCLFVYFFLFYFIFKLYIIVLVLPNIKMNLPQVYM